MTKVYVSEYARSALTARGSTLPCAEGPAITTQVLDPAGTHLSAAFNKETRFIRIHTDGIVSVKIGVAPTAAITDLRMAANQTEYFGVPVAAAGGTDEGYMVDVIANT